MALLTDSDLSRILCIDEKWSDPKKLHIYPFSEKSLTPVGYDLRVGNNYLSFLLGESIDVNDHTPVQIAPGDTVLVTTLETVDMPNSRSLSGMIVSKVSKVSLGLSHISTSVDPDWKGNLLVSIYNQSREEITLEYKDALCTLIFFENLSPSLIPGEKPAGRTDILLQKTQKLLKAQKERIRRADLLKTILPVVVIICFTTFGYFLFKERAGFTASVAIGVGIAQILTSHLWRKR